MAIIITKGNATSVDHNEYDLTLDGAAKELFEGRDIVAREYEDFMDDYSFPAVDRLEAKDYRSMSEDEIIDSIRCYYESYGRIFKK